MRTAIFPTIILILWSRYPRRHSTSSKPRGRKNLDVPLKMQRLRQWCEDINQVQSDMKYDFVYVDQESFDKYKPGSFKELIHSFREYSEPA